MCFGRRLALTPRGWRRAEQAYHFNMSEIHPGCQIRKSSDWLVAANVLLRQEPDEEEDDEDEDGDAEDDDEDNDGDGYSE